MYRVHRFVNLFSLAASPSLFLPVLCWVGSCRQILSLFLLLFFPLHFWLPTSPQPHTLPLPSCPHLLVCITLFALFWLFPLSRDARYSGAGGFRLDSRLPSDWANLCEASSNGYYDCQLSGNGKLGCEALVVSFLLGWGVTCDTLHICSYRAFSILLFCQAGLSACAHWRMWISASSRPSEQLTYRTGSWIVREDCFKHCVSIGTNI